MRTLALDLGTRTGWALHSQADDMDNSPIFESGTWVLATPKEITTQAKADKSRCCDVRFQRLQDYITALGFVDEIVFEDVEFSTYTYQTQLWAGFRTVVSLRYLRQCPKITAVPVGTLKKFATGRGNADKKAMAIALDRALPYFKTRSPAPDDNEVDAIHLLRYALWNNSNKSLTTQSRG